MTDREREDTYTITGKGVRQINKIVFFYLVMRSGTQTNGGRQVYLNQTKVVKG